MCANRVNGGGIDVVALQVVTVGTVAAQRTEALQAKGDYSESYFLHGFSVQSAEALAEWTHRRIRTELRLDPERGKRYSWGYGACPDLSQHEIAFRLLEATERIGVSLTEAFQIVPEQSTAAIVMHHPRASYFNAAAVRETAGVSSERRQQRRSRRTAHERALTIRPRVAGAACHRVHRHLGTRDAGRRRFRISESGRLGIGFLTDFLDTLGIGSFAPTTSLFKFFKLVPDEKIPGDAQRRSRVTDDRRSAHLSRPSSASIRSRWSRSSSPRSSVRGSVPASSRAGRAATCKSAWAARLPSPPCCS